jgi:hypothetical protein
MGGKSRKTQRRHHRRSGRTANVREVRQSFLIVCEGEKTEPYYFRSFDVINTVVEVVGAGCDPYCVVEKALENKKKVEEPYDQVWVVFDRDTFPPERFNTALALAKHNDIQVAYSNEAFELWYVLHFEYLHTGISRQDYMKKLDQHLGNPYAKNNKTLYDYLLRHQQQGIRNAEKLLQSYSPPRPEHDNPSTTVHLLVGQLNRFLRGQ